MGFASHIVGGILAIAGVGLFLYGLISVIPAWKGEGNFMGFGKGLLLSGAITILIFKGLLMMGLSPIQSIVILFFVGGGTIYCFGFYTIFLKRFSKIDKIIGLGLYLLAALVAAVVIISYWAK